MDIAHASADILLHFYFSDRVCSSRFAQLTNPTSRKGPMPQQHVSAIREMGLTDWQVNDLLELVFTFSIELVL